MFITYLINEQLFNNRIVKHGLCVVCENAKSAALVFSIAVADTQSDK